MFWPIKTQREFPEFSTWLQPERWPEFLLDLKGILVARWHIVSLHFCCKNSCNNPLWREGDENATNEKYDLKVWYGLFVFTSVFHLKFNKFVILVLSYRICDLLLLAFLIGVENSEPVLGRREAGSRLHEPALWKVGWPPDWQRDFGNYPG